MLCMLVPAYGMQAQGLCSMRQNCGKTSSWCLFGVFKLSQLQPGAVSFHVDSVAAPKELFEYCKTLRIAAYCTRCGSPQAILKLLSACLHGWCSHPAAMKTALEAAAPSCQPVSRADLVPAAEAAPEAVEQLLPMRDPTELPASHHAHLPAEFSTRAAEAPVELTHPQSQMIEDHLEAHLQQQLPAGLAGYALAGGLAGLHGGFPQGPVGPPGFQAAAAAALAQNLSQNHAAGQVGRSRRTPATAQHNLGQTRSACLTPLIALTCLVKLFEGLDVAEPCNPRSTDGQQQPARQSSCRTCPATSYQL